MSGCGSLFVMDVVLVYYLQYVCIFCTMLYLESMCSLSFFAPFEIWFSGVAFLLILLFSTKQLAAVYENNVRLLPLSCERHYLTTPGLATKMLETTTTSYTPVISN